MSVLIICSSREHGNTRKLADAMAGAVDGAVVTPSAVDGALIDRYDVVGFGSGIRFTQPYPEMLELADRLPRQQGKVAFLFSTSGLGWTLWHRTLRRRLAGKGFVVTGELAVKGLDTMGALRLIGGVNKGRPNAEDLARAAELVRRVAPAAARRVSAL